MEERKPSLRERLKQLSAQHMERMRNDPAYADAERAAKEKRQAELMDSLESEWQEERELTGGTTEFFSVLLEVREETGLDIDTLGDKGSGEFRQLMQAILRKRRLRDAERSTSDTQTVRLSQCAGIVNRSKRTLERWKTHDTAFPTPEVIGDDGKPDEWKWSTIRGYLERKCNRKLPERFPSLSR